MAAAIGLRAWTLDARDYVDETGRVNEAAFRQAVIEELAASEYLGFRLGIAVVSAPIRAQEVDGGEWRTVGWTFRTATVPGITRADAAPDPLDDPEIEETPIQFVPGLEAHSDRAPRDAEHAPADVSY